MMWKCAGELKPMLHEVLRRVGTERALKAADVLPADAASWARDVLRRQFAEMAAGSARLGKGPQGGSVKGEGLGDPGQEGGDDSKRAADNNPTARCRMVSSILTSPPTADLASSPSSFLAPPPKPATPGSVSAARAAGQPSTSINPQGSVVLPLPKDLPLPRAVTSKNLTLPPGTKGHLRKVSAHFTWLLLSDSCAP
jgi:hypothetical protein